MPHILACSLRRCRQMNRAPNMRPAHFALRLHPCTPRTRGVSRRQGRMAHSALFLLIPPARKSAGHMRSKRSTVAQRGSRGLFIFSGQSSERMTRWGPRPPRRAVSTVFRPRHRFGKALCITPPSGAELGGFLACAVVCLYAVPYRAVVQYLPGVLPAFPVYADIHMETGGKFRMGRNVHRLEIKGASGACPESPACAYGLLWNSSSSRHESGLC